MSFVDLLQAETERLGFTLFGITPILAPSHLREYQAWVAAGLHAGMGYLASEQAVERRSHPEQIFPEARSLLNVAMRYPNPTSIPDGPADEALGRIAAYAWGDDYHDVIPPRLEALLQVLESYLGRAIRGRHYTDTGPILERDFAQRAGLGWIGKNTCLISPRHGSYFLIGESFLSEEFEPTPPLQSDLCGTCQRCIQACPTQAIRPDRTIDSGRCISYLTIENKGPIPLELRPRLQDWVFGCDICQTVCPWNLRFAQSTGESALAPRPDLPRPVLRKELRLTPQEFNRKFHRNPVRRAKRRGYLRNVTVALGNQADPRSIPDLAETLEAEAEPLVRAHAAWALGQMQRSASRARQAARNALEKALRLEQEATVLDEIRSAME